MSAAAAAFLELPRVMRRRELLIGAAVTTIVGALLVVLGPAPGDAAVHYYRTWLVRHGILLWDNFSYAGWYPLTSYSLLYYLPTAVVGNLPLVFASAVASTMLFSSIATREWGRAALWPSRVFAVFAAAPMFTGLFAYALGLTAMLATLKLLQLHRHRLAIIPAILTVGFSPLAFAFLCLIVLSYVAVRRGVSRRRIWFAAGLTIAACIEGAVLFFFNETQGVYPFHWQNFVSVLLVSVLGVLRRAEIEGDRSLRRVLRALGSRQRVLLRRRVAVRGQLDPARRVHLSDHAPHSDPRRFQAAATCRARVLVRLPLQRRPVRAPHPVSPQQQHAAAQLLDAGDSLPARPPGAGVSG